MSKVETLLSRGAEIDWPHRGTGRTAISEAALRGHAAVVRVLAREGGRCERARYRYGEFPARLGKSAGPRRGRRRPDGIRCRHGYGFATLSLHATDAGGDGWASGHCSALADCWRGHPRRDCRKAAQRLDLGAGRRTPGDRRAADSRWCAAAHPATRADYSRLARDRH
jgi:hypothetical protein